MIIVRECSIFFNYGDVSPCTRALILALPGYPGVKYAKFFSQWYNLTYPAAFLVAILIETVQAFFPDEFFQGRMFGRKDFNIYVVMCSDLLKKTISFRMQSAGIQGKYINLWVVGLRVRDHRALVKVEVAELAVILGPDVVVIEVVPVGDLLRRDVVELRPEVEIEVERNRRADEQDGRMDPAQRDPGLRQVMGQREHDPGDREQDADR